MVDITLRYKGDASGAVAATRDVADASEEMAGAVDESTESLGEQADAAEESAEAQGGLVITMGDVVKAAKEVIKFVGDSVKEYLAASDASKELAQVAKDLEAAQTGLKKSIGETALELAKEAQLAEAAKGALSLLQTALKGDTEENIGREKRMAATLEARAALAEAKANALNLTARAAEDLVDAAEVRLREAQAAQGLDSSLADATTGALARREKERARAEEQRLAAEAARAAAAEQNQIVIDAAEAQLASQKKGAEQIADLMQKYRDDAVKAEQKEWDDIIKIQMDAQKASLEQQQKAEDASVEASKQQTDRALAESKRGAEAQASQWARIGDTLGASFVNAFNSILDSMLSGGENDPTETILAVLDTVFQVIGTVIGSIFNMPQVGAALGGLASTGVRGLVAAGKRGSGSAGTLTAHNGAWVGAPKYHDGGWVGREQPAILLEGERVLSPTEVDRMGGPAGVDAAASGARSSMQVFVQAIDSRSATESFVRDLGRAQRRAVLSGYGALGLAR